MRRWAGSRLGSACRSRRRRRLRQRSPLDGQPLAIAGRSAAEILADARAIARAYVAHPIAIGVGGTSLSRPRSDLGAKVEGERLALLAEALVDPQSPLRRGFAEHGRRLALPLPVTIDEKRALSTLLLVKDDLDRAPVDARIDLVHRHVVPEEEGRRVDVYATAARLDAALVAGDAAVEAVVERIAPARTAASIGDVAIDDVLGYFETIYNEDKKHAARTFNLRLAASKLDGHVVMPGETFDFNEVVGARSEANGYKIAPVIAQGELVDGIGGGTCQIAGTMHGAAYFAGLPILERRPHTRPSFYIKMGMDATVVYPTITLQFRNDFPHPIVLHETVEDGMVRAEILGPKRTRDVVFVRRIEEVVPFGETEKPDENLPKGERVLAQRGIPGFKIRRERSIHDGDNVTHEHNSDVYPPTQQIWRVGTGAEATRKLPEADCPTSTPSTSPMKSSRSRRDLGSTTRTRSETGCARADRRWSHASRAVTERTAGAHTSPATPRGRASARLRRCGSRLPSPEVSPRTRPWRSRACSSRRGTRSFRS